MSILWTNETWAKDDGHSREWVTRKTGEGYNINCVGKKIISWIGLMFWGCFAGPEKSPCLFCEKKWGSIDSEKYGQKIVPLIDEMFSLRPWLSVMSENAAPHAAARTMEEMGDRAITPIPRPPNPPDLNPIRAV